MISPRKMTGSHPNPNPKPNPKPNPNPKPSSSSSRRSSHSKSRWESSKPSPKSDSKPPTTAATTNNIPPPAHAHRLPFSDPAAAAPAAFAPPPPPAYGFHMLDRRTIVLADGGVRSYFALPPDYPDFPPMPPLFARPDRFFGDPDPGPFGSGRGRLSPEGFRRDRGESDYWSSLGLDGKGGGGGGLEGAQKRKFGDVDERDELARQRQQLMHYGNASSNPNGFLSGPGDYRGSDYLAASTSSPFRRNVAEPGRGMEDFRASKHLRVGGEHDGHSSGTKYHDVDPQALKKAFVHYAKLLNDNSTQKKVYLEDGKRGPLQCLTCGRASREFPDVHGLIMHAYNSHDLRIDHLGLHKALCVLMGWNYAKVPDNSRAYQLLPSDEAQANKEDLVLWPPMVIIHNTMYGKDKDGRVEGIGNKAMDSKIRDLGFSGGKSRSLYGKDGHQGITLVKFAGDQSGLKEALRLADFFEKDNHGRKAWVRVEPTLSGRDEENNVNLVKVDEKTGEKKKIFFGYLGTASDLEKLDFEGRKKAGIESRREYNC